MPVEFPSAQLHHNRPLYVRWPARDTGLEQLSFLRNKIPIQKLPVQLGMCCAQFDYVADVNWEPPAVVSVIKGKKPRSDL